MTDKHNAKAREVSAEAFDSREAGQFYFSFWPDGEPSGLYHACPCGCGLIGRLFFEGHGRGGPEWKVEGSWPNASLTPSIGFYGRYSREQGHHWHGFLTNGTFEEC